MMSGIPEQYRAVVAQAKRLEGAAEGTSQFTRRQELLTAMHDYQLDHLTDPELPGGPPCRIYLIA